MVRDGMDGCLGCRTAFKANSVPWVNQAERFPIERQQQGIILQTHS
jgi:hypothetical protein